MKELHELISSYNDYIKRVPVGCQKIADNLRENRVTEAMQDIIDFSEGVKWLSQVGDYFQQNGILVTLATEKVHEYLNEVNSGLEIEDYIVVADMFEYEIFPFFEESSQGISITS